MQPRDRYDFDAPREDHRGGGGGGGRSSSYNDRDRHDDSRRRYDDDDRRGGGDRGGGDRGGGRYDDRGRERERDRDRDRERDRGGDRRRDEDDGGGSSRRRAEPDSRRSDDRSRGERHNNDDDASKRARYSDGAAAGGGGGGGSKKRAGGDDEGGAAAAAAATAAQQQTFHCIEYDEDGRQIKSKLSKEERRAAALARVEQQRKNPRLMLEEQRRIADNMNDVPGRHWRDKKLEDMTERDWRIVREDFKITVKGGGTHHPLRSWSESNLPQELLDVIEKVGYKEPSPIQRMCLPLGMTNRDVIGVAETGSGKTAAFVLPMIVYIRSKPPMDKTNCEEGPYALILAPTRELANQIFEEANRFCAAFGFKAFAMVGGGGISSISAQSFSMSRGIEILVATPGRLIDQLDRRGLVLNQVDYVVLDEADRMIDMGFEPQVQQILDAIPAKNLKPDEDAAEAGNQGFLYRQTFMFSATFPTAVERLARKYLRRPAMVTVGETGQTAITIEQRVEWLKSEGQKKDKLAQLLNTGPKPPIIVFVNAKRVADVVANALHAEHRIKCTTLHSGKSQDQRESALEGFKSGRFDVLVCTDIASRGIDVSGISHVIQYDAPKTIEDYTHRIGRTGRAGKTGIATLLLTENDAHIFYDLKELLTKVGTKIPPEMFNHAASKEPPERPVRHDTDDGGGGAAGGGGSKGVPTGPGGISYSAWKRQQYEKKAQEGQ